MTRTLTITDYKKEINNMEKLHPTVSDLFFNHTHENYDALDHNEATWEEIEASILEDAKAFTEAYSDVLFKVYTAEAYAQDFLARL